MKTLRRMDLVSMEREFQVLGNPEKVLGGVKGDYNDPYKAMEYEAMMQNGTWSGGYVDGGDLGVGYVLGNVTVVGSATTCSGGTCQSYLNHDDAIAYIFNFRKFSNILIYNKKVA